MTKNNWPIKKLGEICSIKTGKKDVNQGNPNGKYPFFTCAREYTFSDEYSFDTEALLIAGNGDVGHVQYYKGKFEAYQRTYILSEFNENISIQYLLHYLSGFLKQTVSRQKLGNTIPYIKVGMLLDFEIPLPPLNEQQRIVSILDEVIEGIEKSKQNTEKNLQNARELFNSNLEAIFLKGGNGWDCKRIEDILYIKHGFAFKSQYFKSSGEYVLLTPGNFYEQGGYRDRGDKQKYYIGPFPKDYLLKKGDLLVAMTEQAPGLLGSPILTPEDNIFLHNQRLGLIQKINNCNIQNEFLYYYFNTKIVRKEIHDSASGVKVRHTSPQKIGKLNISFPKPLSEQDNIITKLNLLTLEIKNIEAIYKQKLISLDELKKSILIKVFNGEL